MGRYITGFCVDGHCEGTKPRSFSDKPIKTCPGGKCEHDCHKMLDEMFAMSGMERIPVDNPEYVAPKATYWMPSLEERAAYRVALAGTRTSDGVALESDAADGPRTVLQPPYGPTPTGRAARGELEDWVLQACQEWVLPDDGLCSPKNLAAQIAKDQDVSPPSVGAIGAVWDRWTGYGFAKIERNPVRFTGFTGTGTKIELAVLKEKARLSKRDNKVKQKMGRR